MLFEEHKDNAGNRIWTLNRAKRLRIAKPTPKAKPALAI